MAVITSLVSYWGLGEASGNALDSHGSRHLTETSGTIDTTTGKVGGARDFEAGDTEYFAHANHSDLQTGDIDFTIAFWVNPESLPGTEIDLVSKFETVGNQREYRVRIDTTSRISFVISNDGVASVTRQYGTVLSTGTWYFVVAWHDSVGNTIAVSVNDGVPSSSAHSTGVFVGTSPFHIGSLGRAAPTFYFDGLLDEVGFWKRVLTSADITWLYNSGNGRSYADIVAEAGGGALGGLIRPRLLRGLTRGRLVA